MTEQNGRRGFLKSVAATSIAMFFGGKSPAANLQAANQQLDFRGITWGMNWDAVAAAETAPLRLRAPYCLMYDLTLDDIPFMLIYQFADREDEIVCVSAVLQPNHPETGFLYLSHEVGAIESRINDAHADFNRIQQSLTSQFGEPALHNVQYEDEELIRALIDASVEPSPHHELEINATWHDEETIRSLMIGSRWDTTTTNISLGMIPQVFGGVSLLVRHDSSELARLLPTHPDFDGTY